MKSTIEFATKKEAVLRLKILKLEGFNGKIDKTLNNKFVVLFN